MSRIPRFDDVTIADLYRDPQAICTRLRHEAPVAHIPATGRVFITRAADLRHIKESPDLFASRGHHHPRRPHLPGHHDDAQGRRAGPRPVGGECRG